MSGDSPSETRTTRQRRWLIGGAVALVLAGGGFLIFTLTNEPAAPVATPQPQATASAQPTGTPPPPPSVPAATATGTPTVESAKPEASITARIDESADIVAEVTAKVSRIAAVTGVAQGPGEIAGPALRVTVTVSNASEADFDLSAAIVNLYYGKDQTPAGSLSGPGASNFPKSVSTGNSVNGTYVFNVPTSERDRIRVEFRGSPDASVVIFTGAA